MLIFYVGMKLSQISTILSSSAESASVSADMSDLQPLGYSIDSRTVRAGELFFAIRGENNDGHRFVNEALAKGALAAVVARDFRFKGEQTESAGGGPLPISTPEQAPAIEPKLIRVGDTLSALQSLAAAVLKSWRGREVAITGSSGKTTTKDITASLLARAGRVIKSAGNLNNFYGLPLSVLKMESDGAHASDFDFAVLEMGMNHRGEIARLTEIAPPDLGVVTNVAPAHLEFFSSIDAIAEAKAEMIGGIKPGGVAVLNGDDERVARMRQRRRDIGFRTFGIEQDADVAAREIRADGLDGTCFLLVTPRGEIEARLSLVGRHNLYNALAAATVADFYGVPLSEIATGLGECSMPKMRGEVLHLAGNITLIDDSYNSNPRSLAEMADTLCAGRGKRRIVVAGEMLELGESGPDLHRESGRRLAGQRVDLVIGVRGLAREIVAGAREAGLPAIFCETVGEAAELLSKEADAGDVILVKGSRGVKMEAIVEKMKQKAGVA